jgi:hypothetical protein
MAAGAWAASASVAEAQGPRGQPIYAKNNTDRPIWVAAKYFPAGERNYVVNGFWRVNPGERVLIYYNNAVFNYMYARDDRGRNWTGSVSVSFRGENLLMFSVDTGEGYEPYTMNFNP